jgi:hypothetical protein
MCKLQLRAMQFCDGFTAKQSEVKLTEEEF